MPCYKPQPAFQCSDGSVVFAQLARHDIIRALDLPCGQCIGCRLERSRQWAVRCMHEASLYKQNSFVTLTYEKTGISLEYADFQNFIKRLRKKIAPSKVRFYMCGEYGENFGRPHFHACLFGYQFPDLVHWKGTDYNTTIYTSRSLTALWQHGFCTVGNVTFESAAYTARYVMKKITGDLATRHYADKETGELRVPEFNHMSLKPGIGAGWLEKYRTDVYPSDQVIVNGKAAKPPRYYDKKLLLADPDAAELIKFNRGAQAMKNHEDNTTARLLVKEQVAKARITQLKRTIT